MGSLQEVDVQVVGTKARQERYRSIVGQLVTFVNEQFLLESNGRVEAETPILEMGILDSLAIVSLLTFIQTEFNVVMPDEEVTPDNFYNLQTLSRFIETLVTSRQE